MKSQKNAPAQPMPFSHDAPGAPAKPWRLSRARKDSSGVASTLALHQFSCASIEQTSKNKPGEFESTFKKEFSYCLLAK